MARRTIRVEYALAFDIVFDVDADGDDAAIEVGQSVIDEVGLWSAIRTEFERQAPVTDNVRYAGGDMQVTDVRLDEPAPAH